MQDKKVLVVGCGKIGGRVARSLAHDFPVYGLRRSLQTEATNFQSIAADVGDEAMLKQALAQHLKDGASYLLYCLTPSERSEQGYRETYVNGLKNVLQCLPHKAALERLIFVSSTSVYDQDDDSWVDEQSPCSPKQFSGKLILEAEALLKQSGLPFTVVRFSGIYGGTRQQLLKQVKHAAEQGTPILSHTLRRSNRIHEDDCVGFIEHLIRQASRGEHIEEFYLASDSKPVDLNEVIKWLADQLQLTINPELSEQAKRRSGNKQCANTRMLESGYRLRYPSYQEGYAAMLNSL